MFASPLTQVQSYNSHQLQQHLDSFLRRGSKNYTQLGNCPQTSFSFSFPSPLTSLLLPRTGSPKHCCQEKKIYMYFVCIFSRGSWFHSIPFQPFKFQHYPLFLYLVFYAVTLETLYRKLHMQKYSASPRTPCILRSKTHQALIWEPDKLLPFKRTMHCYKTVITEMYQEQDVQEGAFQVHSAELSKTSK